MITIDINDVRVANLVREAVDEKIIGAKSLLHNEISTVNDSKEGLNCIDMVRVTEMVNDINALSEVSSQINVKIQFPAEG